MYSIIPEQAVEAVKEARQSSGSDAGRGVDLDLVLARTFSKWKGHDNEALDIYERLAEVRRVLAPAARLPVPSSPEPGFAMLTNLVASRFLSARLLCLQTVDANSFSLAFYVLYLTDGR